MAIDKKLIFWKKQSTFNAPSSTTDTTGSVMWYSIVFFKDTGQIWTNGTYYNCGIWGTPQTNYVPLTIGGTLYNLSKDGHTHSYLSLSGGTISNSSTQSPLIVSAPGMGNYSYVQYNNGTTILGYLGMMDVSNPSFKTSTGTAYSIWHAGNFNPSSYLPLSGGTMNTGAKITIPSSATGTYGGALEIRERDIVTSTQSSWDYSPRLTFHWGDRVAKGFGIRSDGQFAVDDVPISLSGHNHDRLVTTNAALPQDSCYTTELKGFASWIVDANSTSGGADGYILSNTWTNGTYVTQLYLDVDPTYKMAIRHRNSAGTWVAWKQILTEVNISSYALTAAGGTLTGALNFKNGTWNNVGDDAAIGDINVAGQIGIKALNVVNPGIAFYNNSNVAVGNLVSNAGTLQWSNNTVWHSGNDGAGSGLDADLLDGTHLKSIIGYDTVRDFNNGTLITTNIDYSGTNGDPFYLEIKGNAYTREYPCLTQAQGYIYNNTIINYGVTHLGYVGISGLIALNVNGRLCFWFPRQGYWEGYSIFVSSAYSTSYNRVITVDDVAKPAGTKEVNISEHTSTSAFLNSNVASATKLQTARTIWGQSFNGEGNVSGALTNATTGSFSSHVKIGGGTVNLGGAWDGGLIAGADGHDKIVATYLTSSTNAATIGAHNSLLNAWAKLNVAGTSIQFSINETPKMILDNGGNLVLSGHLGVSSAGKVASFGINSNDPSAAIANQNTFIQIVTSGAANSMGLIFHNVGISTSALEYVNTDSNNGYFNFKSDDTSWELKVNGNKVWHSGNFTPSNYLLRSGDSMTGLLTTTSSAPHSGIRLGNLYLTAINEELIVQNTSAIRFGADEWDYNVWAGLKFNNTNKTIYLGLGDGSIFSTNSPQSGYINLTPGVAAVYLPATTYFSRGSSYYINSTGDAVLNNGNFGGNLGLSGQFTASGAIISNSAALGASTPFAITNSRIQSYASVWICADTDNSTGEGVFISASKGVSTNPNDGLAIYNNTVNFLGNTVWHAGNLTGTQTGHTHNYADLANLVVAGNEHNWVPNGYSGDMWINYQDRVNRGSTALIGGYHLGNGRSGYANIRTSGYIINGYDNNYVVLAGGGAASVSGLSVSYATTASNSYYQVATGTSNDWVASFQNTPAHATSFREMSASGPSGTWWFMQNFRHSNSSGYWGRQLAWGWEDNAHELYSRNIQNGTFSGWVRFLNSSNYNSFSPTLTGGGASGTWGINISGNSATATTASRTSGISGYTHAGTGMYAFYNWGGSNGGTSAPNDSTFTIGISVGSHPGDQSYGFQIGRNMWNTGLWTRGYDSGWGTWYRILDSDNYSSYSPTLIGGGASGTWGISITGNASTATRLVTNYVGGQQLNPQTYFNNEVGLKVAMTAAAGVWSDTLWINGYAGGDVPSMCALHFMRDGTPRMYISTQSSSATAYGTAYEILSTLSIGSYALPKSGGTLTNSTPGILGLYCNTGTDVAVVYQTNAVTKYLGFSSGELKIANSGVLSAGNTVWHTGNFDSKYTKDTGWITLSVGSSFTGSYLYVRQVGRLVMVEGYLTSTLDVQTADLLLTTLPTAVDAPYVTTGGASFIGPDKNSYKQSAMWKINTGKQLYVYNVKGMQAHYVNYSYFASN